MKTNIMKVAAALLGVGLCVWSIEALAQATTTTVTTTKGAFTEYVPRSETVVVKTETNPAPLRYTVTKQTTIVDESGAPVAMERISPGSPISVEYTGAGDHLMASRIIVQRPATVTAPVTTAPAVTTAPVTGGATVTEQQTTTTATHTLTHHEKHALKEQREHRKKALKEEIEHKKDALEEAKDKVEDDND